MIREAVQSQIEKYEWDGGADIVIYIPERGDREEKRLIQDLGLKAGFRYLEPPGS